MKQLFSHRSAGQSLVLMAIFAVTLFAFMGLGIDSSMLYLERRHLQNTTDAACLAAATDLVMGKTAVQARATGVAYITSNLTASANGPHALVLTSPVVGATNSGLGTGLTHGVEVSGTDVRVALTVQANSYFMRVVGVNAYNVSARSRCNAEAGGGVVPIAVNRFPAYDKSGKRRIGGADTTKTLPQSYGGGKKPSYLTVLDVLQKDDGILNKVTNANQVPATMSGCGTPNAEDRNWYDWNGAANNSVANGTGIYRDACDPAGDNSAANPNNPGPEVVLAGSGGTPNQGTNSFLGPVVLDARGIGTSIEYFNDLIGSSNNLNAWKDTVWKYIYTQYPGPDIPRGEQLGFVNGVNAGPLMKAIEQRFNVGDIITTLVYDGTVESSGDFDMSIVCLRDTNSTPNPGCDNDGTNLGRYVYREAPPANPLYYNTAANKCDFKGTYFMGSPGHFPRAENNTLYPATYILRLESKVMQSIQLTARLSTADGAGTGFGGAQVRWKEGSTAFSDWTTGWQDVAASSRTVTLSANIPLEVRLEVVQTTPGPLLTCSDGVTQLQLPARVEGAQAIQVLAQSNSQSVQHSVHGLLGMLNSSGGYASGEYFYSFAGDPAAAIYDNIAVSNDASTIEGALQFFDANSYHTSATSSNPTTPAPTEWFCNTETGGTLACSKDISGEPSGMTAVVEAGAGGVPSLRVELDGSTPPGIYPIDVVWDNLSPVHSARYLIRVVEAPPNPSIDSWVTVICYARFKITAKSDANSLWGQAVSGCLNPEDATDYLLSTSRLLPW